MDRNELAAYLDALLECGRFRDYCPNGLQVEGRAEVRRIVCGVSASQTLLEAALAAGADAVLVHHGWFWRNRWLACALGPWLLTTLFYAVESYHGLGSLRGLGFLGSTTSLGLILLSASKWMPPRLNPVWQARIGAWRDEFSPRRMLWPRVRSSRRSIRRRSRQDGGGLSQLPRHLPRTRSAPSPLAGEGWGGGQSGSSRV